MEEREIVIGEDTYDQMKKISQSSDLLELIDVNNISYNEFITFVEEMGLEEDENVKQIKQILENQ